MAVLTLSPFLGLDMSLGIMPRGDLLEVYRRGSSEHSFAYLDDFGDEAGQGFLHGFSGIVLFLSGLLLIMALDSLIRAGMRPIPAT